MHERYSCALIYFIDIGLQDVQEMGHVLLLENLNTLNIIGKLVVFEKYDCTEILIKLHLIDCNILNRSLEWIFNVLIIDPGLVN